MRKPGLKFLFAGLLCTITSFAQINHYAINQTLIGPGQLTFDIDNDGTNDYVFDIITLQPGVLAARALALGNSKVLDNSTFGYPDALDLNDTVTGYFDGGGVLGTFTNAGQFNGKGNKYLGIMIAWGAGFLKGWIELNCNYNRDTLQIISCGYNTLDNQPINAGQTSPTGINFTTEKSTSFFPNPVSETIHFTDISFVNKYDYIIMNYTGKVVMKGTIPETLNVNTLSNGYYFFLISSNGSCSAYPFIIQH